MSILLAICFLISPIKGYITLQSGTYPVYTAYIEDNKWNEEYWNQQLAWLDGTGWVNNNYPPVIVSHTYGYLNEILYYDENSRIYIYEYPYTYTYKFTYLETISTNDELTRRYTQQNSELLLMICDPIQENSRYIAHLSLESVVYTGYYVYNSEN